MQPHGDHRRMSACSHGRCGGEKAGADNKPGSVEGNHSSGIAVTGYLEQPTREPVRIRRLARGRTPLFGLAPGGVYRAASCYQSRGALLPHLFTLTGKPAVYFLWHFPWARAPQALPGALSEGARTFLHSELQRLPGRLRLSRAGDFTPSVDRFAQLEDTLVQRVSFLSGQFRRNPCGILRPEPVGEEFEHTVAVE